ncbi:hypothetical protein [Mucilaginibacter flavus]|uniref:hypothetical protein n=1 Tax=Mucilaginibacter flavus TaxID=931504 RepID=UPI0025B5F17C|nr:hypothetical protein [Mucilaginibacter flavus]MDN3582093.1 hypothetical protein [Mucilaginibacter flavus]
MKKLLFILPVFLGLLQAGRAGAQQLPLPDVSGFVSKLTVSCSTKSTALETVLDTLTARGYANSSDVKTDDNEVIYENAVDTVRKQVVSIKSDDQGNGSFKYTITASTHDIAEYNAWLNIVRHDPYFLDQSDASVKDQRSNRDFKSIPGAKEKQEYLFSSKASTNDKTKKREYLFIVVYSRVYKPEPPKAK